MYSSKVSLLFFSFSFLFSATNAFNITELLNGYSDYTIFNDYLTQTQVANAINFQSTITVLVVNNGNMGVVSGLPMDTIKTLLSLHALLDYFDVDSKFKNMHNQTVRSTTLYQMTGPASGSRGFVNVRVSENGDVTFASAADGSSVNSKMVKTVLNQPYNISVLEISNLITPPGIIGGNSSSNSNATAPSPSSSSPAPNNSTLDGSPAASNSSAPAPAISPAPSSSPPAPPPSPPAPPPSPLAPSPTNAPAGSPSKPSADAPAGNATADAPSTSRKSSAAVVVPGTKSAAFALMLASALSWMGMIC